MKKNNQDRVLVIRFQASFESGNYDSIFSAHECVANKFDDLIKKIGEPRKKSLINKPLGIPVGGECLPGAASPYHDAVFGWELEYQ